MSDLPPHPASAPPPEPDSAPGPAPSSAPAPVLAPPPTPADCRARQLDWTRAWALFLDLDGTLVDLAETPGGVLVPPGLADRLAALARGLDGALALVSGRPLGDIDRFFPGGLDAAGSHGAEWRLAGVPAAGPASDPAPPGGVGLAAARALVQAGARRLTGVLVEPKPHSIALHYRQAPEHAAATWALAEGARQALGPAYRLQGGKLVVEILPAQAGKGAAIRRFMAHPPYAGRVPVFAGDDLTDEDGFAAVAALGGLGVRVGEPAATAARYRLGSPTALRAWLAALADDLPGTPGS